MKLACRLPLTSTLPQAQKHKLASGMVNTLTVSDC
jgi:hypothetical protein